MIVPEKLSIEQILNMEHPEEILEQARPFMELMMQYKCAMLEVKTKLEVLNEEMSLKEKRNPFESIKSRLKQPASIVEKLRRYGCPISVRSIEENLHDVAGIRVICSFPDDIYSLAEKLSQQDDIRVVQRKDYIANPKENGYRSLHLVVEVPIFLSDRKKYVKVEVQFRTIAMDFWASLEHKVRYKKNIKNSADIYRDLRLCADSIASADMMMQNIRDRIMNEEEKTDE